MEPSFLTHPIIEKLTLFEWNMDENDHSDFWLIFLNQRKKVNSGKSMINL